MVNDSLYRANINKSFNKQLFSKEKNKSLFKFSNKGIFYQGLLRLFPVCFPDFIRQIARYLPHHRSGNASKTHPKSSHDKFKTASEVSLGNIRFFIVFTGWLIILNFHQHFIFSSFKMQRIFSNVVMRVGTKGRRRRFFIIPIMLSMAFTPAGLPSTKSSLNNSVNW